VALVVFGLALNQVIIAYGAMFRAKLELREMTPDERCWATLLGRVGLVAQEIVLSVIGRFLTEVAREADPRQAGGLEEALAQYRWGERLLRQVPLLEVPTENEQAGTAPNQGEWAQLPNRLSLPVGRVLSGLTGIVSIVLANILFVVFVGIFLAASPELYQDRIVRLFPLARRERTREVLNELFGTLQGWLLGQFLAMLIVGVLTALGLWLLGMPLVFTLAFLAFLLEFVPFIGPFLSAVPAVLVARSLGSG